MEWGKKLWASSVLSQGEGGLISGYVKITNITFCLRGAGEGESRKMGGGGVGGGRDLTLAAATRHTTATAPTLLRTSSFLSFACPPNAFSRLLAL